jgi:PrtD family type I secretion system ABC transporter
MYQVPYFRNPGLTRQIKALRTVLRSCRSAFLAAAVFTAVINVLSLSGSIFMMEVYNRVLPSRSLPTLAALTILVVILLAGQGLLEMLRARLLGRIGIFLHERVREHVFDCVISLSVKAGLSGAGAHPVRDLEAVRTFLSGQGPPALLDLPWIPVYLLLLFLFHPYLGMVAFAGGLLVVSLTLLTEALTRRAVGSASKASYERDCVGDAARRNAETVHALGMIGALRQRWREADEKVLRHSGHAGDVALGFSSASRALRMMTQSAVLAVGALLVIQQQANGGLILASAILAARALAPIDVAIAHWRGFMTARESWRRLSEILETFPRLPSPIPLPAPTCELAVQQLTVAPPGSQSLVLQKVSFTLRSGDALAVIGPSASGKSSLARALTGIWPAVAGKVRLDGGAIEQWSSEALGRHIGYLPQRVDMLPGTVAENIARFDVNANSGDIITAAQDACVHELILSLPSGYDTQLGPGAPALSVGQMQRLALARALYGKPFLVVLDEPNANLDQHGEMALASAIQGVRNRGGIVIVVSHRPSALLAVNYLLQLLAGRVVAFGLKEEATKSKGSVRAAVQGGVSG